MQIPQTGTVTPSWAAAQDPTQWLTAPELARCRAVNSLRRAADRIAGRLAVKHLLLETFGVSPLAYEVGEGNPAPALIGWPGPAGLTISLSHSAGLGAASWAWATEQGRVGVDAQWIRPVHSGLAARALVSTERVQADFFAAGEGLLLFWALKEAAIKARRRPWGRALTDAVVTLETGSQTGGTAHVTIAGEATLAGWYARQDGWWLARVLACPDRSALPLGAKPKREYAGYDNLPF